MIVADLFLILIFLLLVTFGVAGYLAWKKVEVFLTYNTRYQSTEYERAVTSVNQKARAVIEADPRGRKVQPTPDLVDISELDFETGYKVVAEAGE